ncbi:MAG TPA: hotdog domain-containing protein [Lapillicoccus sp.]
MEFKVNLIAPARGDRLEARGTVLKSGRTLTICRFEVYASQATERVLVAAGQQTLIRVAA